MKILLERTRAAFPQYYEAKTVNGEGEPAFSGSFLMAPDSIEVANLRDVIQQVGAAKWQAKWPGIEKQLNAQDRICLHDGDMKSNYAGYEGNMFVSARNEVRPRVIDRNKSPLTAQDDKAKSGDYVRTMLDIWAMDNKYGKRICATLLLVQFIELGDRFTGGSSASDEDVDDLSVLEDEEESAGSQYV
jgi:hypothetical protein